MLVPQANVKVYSRKPGATKGGIQADHQDAVCGQFGCAVRVAESTNSRAETGHCQLPNLKRGDQTRAAMVTVRKSGLRLGRVKTRAHRFATINARPRERAADVDIAASVIAKFDVGSSAARAIRRERIPVMKRGR